jgi:lysozyme
MGRGVNEYRLNAHGFRLLTTFEKGPTDGSVPLTTGGAAMAPYVCPGGELTIGYGCTKWFGGRDVVESDRLVDEAHAMALLQAQVVEYEDAVRNLVTVPLNSNQFSGLVSFAFNKGVAGLAGSTILARTNERRFDDAAEAFGMWLYATTGKRKRALRGLLRRSYAESCLYMGLSWDVACSNDAVALVAEPPPNDIGTDRVIFKTPFRDMLLVALRYPLPPLEDELVLTTPASPRVPAAEAAQQRPDPARSPAAAGAASPTITKTVAASPATAPAARAGVPPPSPPPVPAVITQPVGTKPKSPNTVPASEVPYRIDPQAGLKPLEESDRAKGYWYQQAGIGMIRLGSLGVFGTTVQGGAQVLQGDPVLSNLVLTGIVVGGIAVTGYVLKMYGTWRRKRGEVAAVQALY